MAKDKINTEPENKEPVDQKEDTTNKKEDLTKTQILNLEKIKTPDIVIEKEDPDYDFGSDIENKRTAHFAKYKKDKNISTIMMVFSVALLVGAFIMIVQQNQALTITGYVMLGVSLGAMILYYLLNRKKFPNVTKDYIRQLCIDYDRHVFNDPKFKDVNLSYDLKMNLTDIVADRVYAGSTDIGSRNLCHGLFNHTTFKSADLALYKQTDRKNREVVFVGKYLSFENSVKVDGRIIINIKGSKNVDLPSDTEDLVNLKEEGDLIIYGISDANVSNYISSKALNALKKISVKDYLLNLNVVIWGGHTAVYLSYEDAVTNLPFDKKFDAAPINQCRNNVTAVMSALTEN